jgi:hypothetical protein
MARSGLGAVAFRARAELRARFPSMLALALLLGLGAGAVLTLAAGARRTDSAYGRFAREYRAADMVIYPAFGSSFASLNFDEVARQPLVVASAREPGRDRRPDETGPRAARGVRSGSGSTPRTPRAWS